MPLALTAKVQRSAGLTGVLAGPHDALAGTRAGLGAGLGRPSARIGRASMVKRTISSARSASTRPASPGERRAGVAVGGGRCPGRSPAMTVRPA